MHASYSENCAENVMAFIDASKKTLIAGICWFTHPLIFQALRRACARNVKLTLLLNYDHINFQPRGLDFLALEKAGAKVIAYTGPGLWHHKCVIADGCRVLTGSFNWTRAVQCDHVVVLQDVNLAMAFTQAFEAMAANCKSLAQLSGHPPRQLAFSQLYEPRLWSLHDLRRQVLSGAKTWMTVAKTPQNWDSWLYQQRHTIPLKIPTAQWPTIDILDATSLQHWLSTAALRPAARALLTRYGLRMRAGDVLVATASSGNLLGTGIVGADAELLAHKPGHASRFVQWMEPERATIKLDVKLTVQRSGITRFSGSALALIAKMGGV